MTEAELTTDEMLANAKRTVSKEEMESLFDGLRTCLDKYPVAGLLFVIVLPGENGTPSFGVSGVGTPNTEINAGISAVQYILETYPDKRPSIIKRMSEIVSAYADAN